MIPGQAGRKGVGAGRSFPCWMGLPGAMETIAVGLGTRGDKSSVTVTGVNGLGRTRFPGAIALGVLSQYSPSRMGMRGPIVGAVKVKRADRTAKIADSAPACDYRRPTLSGSGDPVNIW